MDERNHYPGSLSIEKSDRLPLICIIGGGPAGLMAADVLSRTSCKVLLFDAKSSIGRKLLVAGKGGLNLTHSESVDQFLARYGDRKERLRPYLESFGPVQVRKWASSLGIETFVGTSGRVFPVEMRTFPLLKAWTKHLSNAGVEIKANHRWQGWNALGELVFSTPSGHLTVRADATILALGGGSWAKLGSDGAWVSILQERNIPVAPFKPANCGFNVNWSEHFKQRFSGHPLKTVQLILAGEQGQDFSQKGELIITGYGIEGSLVYSASAFIRDRIAERGPVKIFLDLLPDRSLDYLAEKLSKPRGSKTLASHLQKTIGIQGVKAGLLREVLDQTCLQDPNQLARAIKRLPLILVSPRPLDEAISTAGGVCFEALDDHLMIRTMPGIFCAGEMLDWEAPTGGYLITACLATGRAAALGVINWLGIPVPPSLP